MRKVSSIFLTVLFTTLSILSCGDKQGNNPSEISLNAPQITVGDASKSYPNVDSRLWVYFERFEEEGINRGMDIDLIAGEVTAEIKNIASGAAGTCTTTTAHTIHHLTLDLGFWESSSDGLRELIVFHELGHCYLHRGHNNAAYPNGVCKSLLREGQGECIDNYNQATRDLYLDELFHVN